MLASNVISLSFPRGAGGKEKVNITFSEENSIRVNPHDNDPLTITIQHGNWNIK